VAWNDDQDVAGPIEGNGQVRDRRQAGRELEPGQELSVFSLGAQLRDVPRLVAPQAYRMAIAA
jgi:hypothetical protein